MKTIFSIGLMSGTSADGIDVSLIETDGEFSLKRLGSCFFPYTDFQRSLILDAMHHAQSKRASWLDHEKWDFVSRDPVLHKAHQVISEWHRDSINHFCYEKNIPLSSVDCIGFHGQTVDHDPQFYKTLQLGSGSLLSESMKKTVVWDFRSNDMLNKGQGAPLVPVYHLVLKNLYQIEDAHFAVINIGGIVNATLIKKDVNDDKEQTIDEDMINNVKAFDIGPGNAVLDDYMRVHFQKPYDRDGFHASTGAVHEHVIEELLSNHFFSILEPKSLDRFDFHRFFELVLSKYHLPHRDNLATRTAFVAYNIVHFLCKIDPTPLSSIILCGGGRRNKTLVHYLKKALSAKIPHCKCKMADEYWDGDYTESEAFAYLAVRRLKNKPITFPSTTGTQAPCIGGSIAFYSDL